MGYTGRGHDDPYQVLGVDAGASQRDIVHAYRQGVRQAHPNALPHDPGAAARRFQALTAAYDLLRDPGRRAAYDRGHPAREPGGQLPRPGQLIWAGPVHVQPPAAPASQHARGAAAEFDDPALILGMRPRRVWGWP